MTLIAFESIPILESNEPLVALDQNVLVLEPSYFQQKLSQDERMFLRQGVVERLMEVQRCLPGFRIKIFDGFRSRDVQRNIYQKYWNEMKGKHPDLTDDQLKARVGVFATDPDQPSRIPPHSTGGAVDLTLADKNGNELAMGTAFDHFGPEAAAFYYENYSINETVRQNRKRLREAMDAAEFRQDKDEWWHFDYGNQLWAYTLHKPHAMYGEIKEAPRI
ncbi:MAG: M15 family metallopeptidase [Patescibacteria group bacterium]|jgi:D-alanyl-D-alanine dipeptidase